MLSGRVLEMLEKLRMNFKGAFGCVGKIVRPLSSVMFSENNAIVYPSQCGWGIQREATFSV
jgi:hypothetical protein